MPITETPAWAEATATVNTKERILITLEISHSVMVENGQPAPVRAVLNNEDIELRLEETAPLNAGERVTFQAVPFGVDFPRIGKLGAECSIWIDNVNREVARYLEPASKLNESVVVIFRGYLLSDTNTVGHGPFRLLLRNVKRKGSKLEGSLTIADPTRLRVMREIFDNERFAALMVSSGI
jgi:hypothetical protein